MNQQTQNIVETMWGTKKPIPEALLKELKCVEDLCIKTDVKLLSKQTIASIIAPYLKE